MPDSDIRIIEAQAYFLDEKARTPLKFGAVVMDGVTLCYVRVRVENRRGQVAEGWGAIFLSDVWAFPTPRLDHAIKDKAMRRVTQAVCRRASDFKSFAHPIDIFLEVESELKAQSAQISRDLALTEEMPFLAALVCASPVDAAIHDAFGVVNGIPTYVGYQPEFVSHDLGAYLGPSLRGRYLSDFVRLKAAPTVPIFHLVGGLDALRESD